MAAMAAGTTGVWSRLPARAGPRRSAPQRPAGRVGQVGLSTVARAQAGPSEVPDMTYGFIAANQGLFRSLPLYAGGAGVLGVLVNRIVSGIAPVVDASSSQSRADVLVIMLSAVLLLTGLQWLSLKPRATVPVPLDAYEAEWFSSDAKLPAAVIQELKWAWESLRDNTRCRSLVLLYKGRTLAHLGSVQTGQLPGAASAGDICKGAMSSGQGNYLANLVLYPGRAEFTKYLPENTQGVVVQPVGNIGVLVAGTDTVRGFSRLDQAWVAAIADKLEVSLEPVKAALDTRGVGFGQPGTSPQ